MEDRKVDGLIQETLEECVSQISMSQELQREIKRKVRMDEKEKYSVKLFSKRRVVILAAVLCLFGSMVVVGAGKRVGSVTHISFNKPDFVSLSELHLAENQMGCSIKAVDKFSNGYQFQKGFISEVREVDDNGVILEKYPETELAYIKGTNALMLNVVPAGKQNRDAKHKEIVNISYGEITLIYTKDIYKFVPINYEMTLEEEAWMESGNLHISYGSNEIEVKEISSIKWSDGADYLLLAYDESEISQNELVEMAKEIIDAS